MRDLSRRGVIGLAGGAAAWPLTASAHGERVRRVGMLLNITADDPQSQVLCLLKISTGLREAGDFRELAVPSRSWRRFSLPLYRSWFSVFAAASRSNSRLSLLSISWPCCADNAPADLSFPPWIAFYGCCSTLAADHRCDGICQAGNRGAMASQGSGSTGAGDHAVRDDPRSAQRSVL
jgi:hypothetical protein